MLSTKNIKQQRTKAIYHTFWSDPSYKSQHKKVKQKNNNYL